MVVKPGVSKANYIPAIEGELKASILTIEDQTTGKTLNVKDTLALKQNILIAGSNITIINDTISSSGGGITQADLDTKQNFINDGDLSFAKTSGLVSAINSTAKLASFNNFTANQTITGDLLVTGGAIANTATVLSTTPTLDGHLTSKLYVDNELNKNKINLMQPLH